MKAGTIQVPDLVSKLDQFIAEKPCALVRLIYEKAVLRADTTICGVDRHKWVQTHVSMLMP